MTDWAGRLREFARRRPRIVCLPDFYVDHFIELPPLAKTMAKLRAIHARGGGSWLGVRQRFLPGGNAGNTARGLAALGADVHLIARTDTVGRAFARATVGAEGVNVSRVRAKGRLGTTAVLEVSPGPVNVMLNEPGGVSGFSTSDLTDSDRRLIESADAVFVGNWSQTGPTGTALAKSVLRWAHRAGTMTFVDTSDPTDRQREVPNLRHVLRSRDLDVLAVNENELRCFAGAGDPLAVGARFARRLHATLDLHTVEFAASWRRDFAFEPAFAVHALRATGAGDAWNAGNMLGHLASLEAAERLRLANAVAALYVSDPSGQPPKGRRVASFLRRKSPTLRPR